MVRSVRIRVADPSRDAPRTAEIYRSAVESTIATFEETPPTAEEMAERMRATLERLPWLVAESGGEVVGYAYAAAHHRRPGYRWSVDVSVYVDPARRGAGVGRALYDRLLEVLRRQRFVNVYAAIALPNTASERLHAATGMRRIGVYERVGYKFGAWHDVAWFGLRLTEPAGSPPEPIPLPKLEGGV
jgi:L-amino acid N-acyltransferase YncA